MRVNEHDLQSVQTVYVNHCHVRANSAENRLMIFSQKMNRFWHFIQNVSNLHKMLKLICINVKAYFVGKKYEKKVHKNLLLKRLPSTCILSLN